jgi:Surface-adhesin protein E
MKKTTYSKNMGKGNIIDTFDEPDQWNPVIPESASGALLYKACRDQKLKL